MNKPVTWNTILEVRGSPPIQKATEAESTSGHPVLLRNFILYYAVLDFYFVLSI